MTVLIVAHETDDVASSVDRCVADRGRSAVRVTPGELSADVSYRREGGRTIWVVRGRQATIRSDDITAVLNRARFIGPSRFDRELDEHYAACERAALFSAVLTSLPGPVVNPPQGASLSGPPPRPAAWLVVAARLGLPVVATALRVGGVEHEEPRRRVGSLWVIDRSVHGAPDDVFAARSLALAARLGCRFLQLDLWETVDRPFVIGRIEPTPEAVQPAVASLLTDDLLTGAGSGAGAGPAALVPSVAAGPPR